MHVSPLSRDQDSAAALAAYRDSDAPRLYEVWRGSNIFFLKGRFIFGPDVRSLFLTIFLIVAPVSIFCVFVARKLMNDFPHHSGASVMVVVVAFTIYDLVLLLLTSGRDPGIVPRNRHPPEPESYDASSDNFTGQTPPMRLPRVKDVLYKGMIVKVKYCDTCMLYRPPRCSHCSICNNCVERFDHHCPWVGQCIGIRNYIFFFMFIFSTTLLCIFVFGFCWVYIKRIKDTEHITFWHAMIKTPASIVLIIYTFASVWFVGGLSVFHSYLVSSNQTTYENFRYRYDRQSNPYNKGAAENIKEFFCKRIPSSKNDFRARVLHTQEPYSRQLSVGFISPNMSKAARELEIGRKPLPWGDFEAGGGDLELALNSNVLEEKERDVLVCDPSPNFTSGLPKEGPEVCAPMRPRPSSWGKTGSWEISPDAMTIAAGAVELSPMGSRKILASAHTQRVPDR